MKCNQIEELLPLYVHSDLDRKRASAVAAHLAFCLHCRQITEEFEQAQQWMGLYEPSDFDDATFDDATFNSIRQNVLNEINRTAANSGLFELAFRFFRQRAFASVFAVLLVIISWVAFNLYVTRTTDVRDGAAGEQRVEKIAPDKKHNAEDLPTIVSNTPHTERVLPSSTGMLVAARRRYTSSSAARQMMSRPSRVPSHQVVVKTPLPQAGNEMLDQSVSTTIASVTPQNYLRIELKTGDPKIRIIWLAPQISGAQ